MRIIRGSEWSTGEYWGLNPIPVDRLYDPKNQLVFQELIRPESVPTPGGQAIAFGLALNRSLPEGRYSLAQRLVRLYVRGLTCQELRIERLPLPRDDAGNLLPLVSAWLESEQEDWAREVKERGLQVLKDRLGRIVAYCHPDTLWVPNPEYSSWPLPPGHDDSRETIDFSEDFSAHEQALKTKIDKWFADDPRFEILYVRNLKRLEELSASPDPQSPPWRHEVDLLLHAAVHATDEITNEARTIELEPLIVCVRRGFRTVVLHAADVPDFSEILVSHVVKKPNKGDPLHRFDHYADWPITSENFSSVRSCKFLNDRDGNVFYEIITSTGWRSIVSVRYDTELQGDFDPVIMVWPHFALPGWRHYETLFSPGKHVSSADFRARLVFGDGKIVKCDEKAVVTVTDERPRFVEIVQRMNHAGNEQERPCGLFEIPPPRQPTGSLSTEPWRIALDFGTANTCLSYEDPDKMGDCTSLVFSVDWHRLLADQDEYEFYRQQCSATFLHERTEIPSELAATTNADEALYLGDELARGDQQLGLAVSTNSDESSYRPRPDVPVNGRAPIPLDASDEKIQLIKHRRLLCGFKWTDPTLWPKENPTAPVKLEDVERAAQIYLRQVLTAAAAEAIMRSKATMSVNLGYPQAFDELQLTKHVARINAALKTVKERTGVNATLGGIVSEAYASLYAALLKNLGGDYILVMDVGGGTADYAVSRPFPLNVPSTSIDSSSLRLAGNAILQAVAAAAAPVLAKNRDWPADYPQLAALELGQKVRAFSKEDLNFTLAKALDVEMDPSTCHRIGNAVAHVFLAISYFGLLMVAARILEDASRQALHSRHLRVSILLAGNGWSLCCLHPDRFTKWLSNPEGEETELAKQMVEEAWKAISDDTHERLPSGCTLADLVAFDFHRVRGKELTAKGMVFAPAQDPEHLKDLNVTREPLALRAEHYRPQDRLPIFLGDKTGLGNVTGIWGMPTRLKNLFGGEQRVLEILRTLGNARTSQREIGYGAEWKEGNHLVKGPLRLLLEQHLLAALCQ